MAEPDAREVLVREQHTATRRSSPLPEMITSASSGTPVMKGFRSGGGRGSPGWAPSRTARMTAGSKLAEGPPAMALSADLQ